MDKLYETIYTSNDVEAEYNEVNNQKLRIIFAFMIATMFRFELIDITPEFGAKLYMDVVNGKLSTEMSDKIYDFVWSKIVNEAIDAMEKEINE